MNKFIEEAVSDIDNNIKELEERKLLLLNLDTEEILTEDKWHEICETSLRYSNILSKFVLNIFPEATLIKVGCNYVTFELYNIKCYLPTSLCRGIEVDVSWFDPKRCPEYNSYVPNRMKQLDHYLNDINWKSKTKAIMGPGYKTWWLWLNWILKYKYKRKSYKKEFNEMRESVHENYEIGMDIYKEHIASQKAIIHKIENNLIPELSKFTDNINAYYESVCFGRKTLKEICEYYK